MTRRLWRGQVGLLRGSFVASLSARVGIRCKSLRRPEHRFDAPAVLVASIVVLDRSLAITATGDDRDGVLVPERGLGLFHVVTAVGNHLLHKRGVSDEQIGAPDVGREAGRRHELERPAHGIEERMHLGRTIAQRHADDILSCALFLDRRCGGP